MKQQLVRKRLSALLVILALGAAACGGDDDVTAPNDDSPETDDPTTQDADPDPTDDAEAADEPDTEPAAATDEETTDTGTVADDAPSGEASTFTAEVWADNWFALYANGEMVGEDSVPITTERSFNAETITFEASYPLTIAVEAKDFKETDSGIEYIGAGNQQMGDGGLILQVTDDATGQVVAVTSGAWSTLVVHRAPLNTECEKDADPDTTCEFEIIDSPDGWTAAGFDDSAWGTATEWSEADVSPKDGYDEIDWDESARLIWGSDLEVDNTVLLRIAVPG